MDSLISKANLSLQELCASQDTAVSGLSEKEAENRLKKVGPNQLIEKVHFTVIKLLWESFFSPLVLLLLVASFISSVLGDFKDFIIIFSIVLLSGSITFYQHFKANNAAEKLKKKVQLDATVVRDGIRRDISFEKIVPGDVLFLSAGDIIPADGRVIEEKDLTIDESTLTGEAFPAQKSVKFFQEKVHTLSNLTNIAFAGTHTLTGEAKIIIFATGRQTQLGQLSREIVKAKPKTDFDIGVENLSLLMIKLILILCFFVFGINAFLHHEILTSFTFAVALAVGLTPELMPVILTINLSRGALRMEKKEVIVKYLPAIQNLGSMDILCTDKTGTLTESAITLTDYQNISGDKSENVLLAGILDSTLKSGVKEPLDQAILRHEHNISLAEYKKIDEIPFDFNRKRASVIVQDNKKQILLITKGAPQKMLPLCTTYTKGLKKNMLTHGQREKIERMIQSLNKQGYRVLIVASKKVNKQDSYEMVDENHLTYLGILIFQDVVKTTVNRTINELKQLGISIKILTGDNELVTQKVCSDVHIQNLGTLLGDEIDGMNNQQLEDASEKITIFARLTPEQKSRIIEALKRKNHVVGYLGDGVNDAPPLKASDVGISVNNGSDIARDVADIVLMRKSLSILQQGVQEGRKTHANIFKYIFMSLSSNFGNMMSVAIASIFLPFLPMLPIQILLIDFLYDFSQITTPMDTVDLELVTQPQQWNLGFIKRFTFVFGPISSVFDICTFLGLLFLFHSSPLIFRTGWFLESVITQTLIIFAIRTRRVPFFRSLPSIPITVSAIIAISLGFIFVNTPLAQAFSFTHLPSAFYLFLIVIVIIYFSFVEVGKKLFYKYFFQT